MFDGNVAEPSLEVSLIVSAALSGFQKASTALTVTGNGAPSDSMATTPLLPDPVPGAATSGGTSSCSFLNAAGATITGVPVAMASVDTSFFSAAMSENHADDPERFQPVLYVPAVAATE